MSESPSERYKKRVFQYDRIKSGMSRRTRGESGKDLGLGKDLHPYKGFIEISKKIMARDSITCQICGKTEATSNGLIVHHKNGIKTDQREENLITVCHSCHRRLHPRKKGPHPLDNVLQVEEIKRFIKERQQKR